ncbi:MAG: energy-dependent translational throttle protein EttA [Elusimicrobia bacterium]|nr:MAG: energy-dependent translational throttle protein EttA [Elusimicrobiota bacterium]
MATVDTQKIIYTMHGIGKMYPPKKHVLKEINLSFFYGAKIGIIGDNGSGKSTLLKIMAGIDQDFTGEITQAKGYTIGLLEQEPALDNSKTVKEIVEEGVAETKALLDEYEAISNSFTDDMDPDAMEKALDKQGKLQDKIEAVGAWELDHTLEVAMDAMRCPPGDQKIAECSGGERRRAALCRLLLQKPDILLLDEPTNHLDAETVGWLENFLKTYKGTVIVCTHDRYFLDKVTSWILELYHGEGIPWKGNYEEWLIQKQEWLRKKEKEKGNYLKSLAREADWVAAGTQGRQAKSKARLKNYEEMLEQDQDAKGKELEIYIPPGPRLGDKVIEAKGVSKAYDDKLLFENLDFSLPRGGIVGVIGANGAGKTTLFRLITGQQKPDSGTFDVGETVKLAYVDQERSDLNPDETVFESITGGADTIHLGKREVKARGYVASFNFTGSDQQREVGVLSGGERNRVHLARLLKDPGNVLLLDEPTNDLDIHTLRALEEAIVSFAGCVVVITHDRWFLDRIATHMLAFEGNSKVVWYEGDYSAYDKDYKQRMGEDATPKRIHYKSLTKS